MVQGRHQQSAAGGAQPDVVQPPVPVNPYGRGSLHNDTIGNWKQARWVKYLNDLGAVPGDRGECLAAGVELGMPFSTADAVAKAFSPGTSGKSGDDYANALKSKGMDSYTAKAAVNGVYYVQLLNSCPGNGGIGEVTSFATLLGT